MGHSMRTARYRFTEWIVPETDFQAIELYDHQTDPDENVNLANRPEHSDLVEQLKNKHQLPLTAESTQFINTLVMKEYLAEFHGIQAA